MTVPLLEAKGLKKSFNGVEVLHSVDLILESGKAVALVGENGAGKSTLMKILMGEYKPDGGEIYLNGVQTTFQDPHQALIHGISMIFQEMSPFPNLTVAENIFVGRESQKFGFLNKKEQKRKAQELLDELGIRLDINQKVKDLTVSEIQLLEIAKAVSYHSKIVIMDEPTSALTDSEVKLLFHTIKSLKDQGVAIVYITHKLDELKSVADQVCVLRDGSIISTHPIEEVSQDIMISEMVGRKLENIYPVVEKELGKTALSVKGLSREGEFHDLHFEVRHGEILGFAGMVGSGRTEILSALFGIAPAEKGSIFMDEAELKIHSPQDAIKNHFAFIPEDRANDGLNLTGSVRSNIGITRIGVNSKCHHILANSKAEVACAEKMIKQMRIKVNDQNQQVNSLSGGNQQKIVVAKWLLTEPEIVFLDEPTRGIDVGAKFEIYQLIQNIAKAGKAVIMVSSELSELLGICDRILVLKEGRIVGEMSAEEASQERIMSVIVNG